MQSLPQATRFYTHADLKDVIVSVRRGEIEEHPSSSADLLQNETINRRERDTQTMNALLRVNAIRLHPQRDTLPGRRLMVAFDGSPASWKALEAAAASMGPADHLWCVHIRRLTLAMEAGYLDWADCSEPSIRIRCDFSRWQRAKKVAEMLDQRLAARQPPVAYSVVFPEAVDVRTEAARLAKELNVVDVYIGKHTKADKPFRDKNLRFRSFRGYMKNNIRPNTRCFIVS